MKQIRKQMFIDHAKYLLMSSDTADEIGLPMVYLLEVLQRDN